MLSIIHDSVAPNSGSLQGNMKRTREISLYTVHKHSHSFKGGVCTTEMSCVTTSCIVILLFQSSLALRPCNECLLSRFVCGGGAWPCLDEFTDDGCREIQWKPE